MLTLPRLAQGGAVVALIALVATVFTFRVRSPDASNQAMPIGAGADFADAPPPMVATGVQAAAESRAAPKGFAQTAAPGRSAAPFPSQQVTAGMVIRNGDVSVEVDSVETAMARIRQLASALGGYIGNVSTHTGEHQVRSATLELKIPAARFDDAMSGMTPIGKVERSSAMAHDVGEEFVDLTARVENARRLEARLVALLAQRTGKLEDVLAVERELARVREEIERYEGRLRYLSSRVATSTIVATVHEKMPIVAGQPGTNVFVNAFVNMWRNFIRVIAAGIESLGVAIPLALLGWLGWVAVRRWRRATA
ncbi:MAG TPA: DUF4349 domain-containing protein [Gemmatimonadaceae bacterium]|nr:DUF4349 domain-containing protein [Gemmatimonadaceae bacterium]